ncbi:hypothetical protein SSP531S_08060 [Streptomyces spongiicola]|uniref:Uncharacterized protein n=1 Tax=Streptomyces spongiicola TaxID=1690221 RepID=A0A388SU79_9ACTN|nr:hypothetical protein [Streptomyces spongiicola]GBP99411.1 hypothetical protein SSP531S_08060 [Streptomyces spongiicola]
MKRIRVRRTLRTTALAAAALAIALGGLPASPVRAAEPAPRIDLRVLVVSDGGPATAAIAAELDGAGTPYTVVDLSDAARPVIDAAFLADEIDGRPRARYQAVVLPNDNPFPAGSPEMAALAAYERTYAIPQVDAYTYARPQAGLEYPVNGGYAGPVDGITAQVTAAGEAGPFGYLDGSFAFEDNDPSVDESWGFLSTPRAGADFTTYVDAPLPGGTGRGSLVGEYRHDGRRELVVTFVANRYQQQFRLLARGIVDWMTQEVRLGTSRNWFSVHVDDVFASDDRWDTELNCTPGDVDCRPGEGTPDPIRMTPGDATHAVEWSRSRDFTLDLAYNGGGSVEYREEHGADPLADRLTGERDAFRWINHTYDHPYLGCEQDVSVVPWKCAVNADGTVRYVGRDEISRQISDNRRWAEGAGLPLDSGELVTGEHSGLRLQPQQPEDNPHLAPALADNGVRWLASDNSRDPVQRQVGPALTVSRHPMNVFYNAGREAEQVDEYNWIYTSRAQGGSGICEDSATTTCLDAPLDPATGYPDHIVPLETRIALGHILANDPRPHFIHQSNLAEDRIAYPVLDGILGRYAELYADDTPLVNPRMSEVGEELRERAAWDGAVKAGLVTAYRIGDTVTVTAPPGTAVRATMPAGTTRVLPDGPAGFGEPYAGTVSGSVPSGTGPDGVALSLPSAPAAGAPSSGPARATAPAPEGPVPAGAERPVSPGAERRPAGAER